MSNCLGVEAHFEALWKKLEFPSSLELFPPSWLALNICSYGLGLDKLAGIKSGGVDHTLDNMDVSYFNKVKCSMLETHRRAQLSDTSDKNPSQECKFWVVNRNSAPHSTYASKTPARASLSVGVGYDWSYSDESKASSPS